jgi:hypothetical protein
VEALSTKHTKDLLTLSHYLLPLLHRKSNGLGAALQKLFLHHHHLVEVLLEFPVDPLLLLPCWNDGTEVVIELNV